eukprot:7227678-Heterocapsa_arctica.AAC.1
MRSQAYLNAERAGDGPAAERPQAHGLHSLRRRGDEKLRDFHVRWDDALLDIAEEGLHAARRW